MEVLVVEFQIAAKHIHAFADAISSNALASLNTEPGCKLFDVCRDPADASLFLLYELYDDRAALQAHLRSPHFVAMDAATTPWVTRKVVRQLTLQ